MSIQRLGLALMYPLLMSCAPQACDTLPSGEPVVLLAEAQSLSGLESYVYLKSDPSFRQIEGGLKSGRDVLAVERFEVRREIMGYDGRLEYVFYFGKLAETRFHPDDPARFFRMAETKSFPSKIGSEVSFGDLVFWVTGRRNDPQTLGASDSRLVHFFMDCVAAND